MLHKQHAQSEHFEVDYRYGLLFRDRNNLFLQQAEETTVVKNCIHGHVSNVVRWTELREGVFWQKEIT